jgi:4'-phosphopantetheinyl transferase
MVACAIALEIAVGIDVENPERQIHVDQLARSYFAPNEVAHLSTLPSLVRTRDFFIQWTLKEAFLKAIGMGLHAPISTLSIIPEARTLRVNFTHPFPDSVAGWGFAALTQLHGHHLALAIRSEVPQITIRLTLAPCFWANKSL